MIKKMSMIFGGVLVILGLLGFFQDPVLWIFQTDTVHNLIHIILGLALMTTSQKVNTEPVENMIKVISAILLIFSAIGFASEGRNLFGFITTNQAVNWLHAFLGVIALFYLDRLNDTSDSKVSLNS